MKIKNPFNHIAPCIPVKGKPVCEGDCWNDCHVAKYHKDCPACAFDYAIKMKGVSNGEIKEQIKEILIDDLVNHNSTHENAPPNKDCMEECKVKISDIIAASNPYSAPVRSSGEKHKKCYECWEQYINGLADKILKIFEQTGYEAIKLKEEENGSSS